MTPYPSDILGPLIVVWMVMLLIWAGVYVWYALMLSRLFPRLGTEAWKGWVPILNEAEILRLGGVPAWSVVFYFLPLVNLYGLYLKFVATSRINAHFGRGVGTTVLAVLLPPVWATLLVVGSRPVDPALQERIAPSIPERSGYALAVSTPPAADPQPVPGVPQPPAPGVPSVPGLSPASGVPPMAPPPPVAPPPPAAFPGSPAPTAGPAAPPPPPPPAAPPASATSSVPAPPPAFPPPSAAPGGVLPPPPLVTPPAPPAPLPAAAPTAPAVSAEPAPASPPPAPPAPPSPPPAVASEPPVPTVVPEPPVPTVVPEPAHIVPPPGLLIPPPPAPPAAAPAAPPAPPAPAAPVPTPAAVPAQPWSPLAPPAAPVTPPAAAPTPEPADEDEEAGDELDRTVVVDRRPRIPWVLRVEEGPEFRLTGSSVVLGRRPTAAAGTQDIAVPDPTRTLSKVHARLDLADGVWTVTDLNATNGVIVVAADGTEELLDPGASAVVVERFVLGKVGMRIALDDAADG